ncbi:MAG: DUF6259 domain-containing protein [Bryobacteraceae bacterium]|jgi:hypothetical protein
MKRRSLISVAAVSAMLAVQGAIWLLFPAASVYGAPPAQIVDPSKPLVLANSFVQFEFEPQTRGLVALIDQQSHFNHIQPAEGRPPEAPSAIDSIFNTNDIPPAGADKHLLWEVDFAKGTQRERITNNYRPCSRAYIEQLEGGGQRAVMEWNDMRWWAENKVISVRATVELPKDSGVALWRIAVDNASDYWGMWSVTYPLVKGLPASGQYDIARPVFASGGNLLKKCTQNVDGRYPSGDWPMQFMSLNRGQDAVYFASMDPDARAKDFVAHPGERLAMVHYVDNMGIAGSSYPDYYPVALGVYRGGWVEAAQRYREWALQQKWVRLGKLSQRTDVPDAAKDIALWLSGPGGGNAQGSAHELDAQILEAQKRMGVPIAMQWHGWNREPFDNLYPHYTPREETPARVKELVAAGVVVTPYVNSLSVDMNIPDYNQFAPHANTDVGGGVRMHLYSGMAGRLVSMCPGQVFWQNTIAGIVDKLAGDVGVNGVYLDQVSAMPAELCFRKDHGHPVGGGSYWADGNRDLLRLVRLQARRNGRNLVITSEAADEVFYDLLDANLMWFPATDQEIPLMEVVYSGYTLFFDTPTGRGSDRLFHFGLGQGLIDGRQNSGSLDVILRPENAARAAYLRQCVRYRVATKKYLTFGRLLEPIDPVKPVPTFTEQGFGQGTSQHEGTVPSAEGRLWQAEDGRLGIFLVNYTDQVVPFSYRIDPAKFGLKGARYSLAEIGPDGSAPIGDSSGVIERTEQLGAGRIMVIEISAR